jgi:hypothetical protein
MLKEHHAQQEQRHLLQCKELQQEIKETDKLKAIECHYSDRMQNMPSLDEKRKRVVGSVSVGPSPKRLKEQIQTMVFRINDFANRVETRGEEVITPTIRAFDCDWNLMVYPRGDEDSSADEEYISCFLNCVMGHNDEAVAAKLNFRCKNKCNSDKICVYDRKNLGKGFRNYLTRKEVLEYYLDEDGTLVIEVDIQIAVDKESEVWYPRLDIPNVTLTQLYRSSFEDEDSTADVIFKVDGKEYHAHKSILSIRAKTIYELVKDFNKNDDDDADNEKMVPISMEGKIFEIILEFLYCVCKPAIEDKDIAIKLLLAADRLECTDLKHYVESKIVESFIDASNAANWLVLSDSHSCPLLKEASMKICASDAGTVMESEGWSQIEESNRLVIELFKFCMIKPPVISDSNRTKKDNNNNIVENLDITSLRERLLEANLDIDGSREMLVERLKEHYSPRKNNDAAGRQLSRRRGKRRRK